MSRPAILDAIDAALTNNAPEDVRATAEGSVISTVQDHLGISGSRVTIYSGVLISGSLAQIENGWMVGPRVSLIRTPDDGGDA